MFVRVVKKRQFWLVIRMVKMCRFGWLLGWLKNTVLGGY